MPYHKETPFLSAIMFFDNRLFLTVLFFWTYVLFCAKYVCGVVGNADRHHYETFKDDPDKNEAVLVMFDSAKSFGNPYRDEHSILAALYQCCQ